MFLLKKAEWTNLKSVDKNRHSEYFCRFKKELVIPKLYISGLVEKNVLKREINHFIVEKYVSSIRPIYGFGKLASKKTLTRRL